MPSRFQRFQDRVAYVLAEGQLLVLAVLFSGGVAMLLFKPDIPRVPPVVGGILAAGLLFGPIMFAWFVTLIQFFRTDDRETLWHINGVTDEREKYRVKPEVLDEMEVDGPAPQPVNDGRDLEVREFDWYPDTETLRVRGTYMSALADSKLVTVRSMLEDIHGDLIKTWLSFNRLRGRIKKMGVQIQNDVINEEAEADERGQMNPKTAVKDRFEAAKQDAENADNSEIQDVDEYAEAYADEHGIETTSGPPATQEQAATDGGSRHG
ncbi:hypothetical protein [Halorubellus litoreus]|uniref:PrgI family protein n=1 Tax=Halorubellus litoreus TaxID=755308 RepID=A0ABD5VFI4_9EURY